MQLAACCPGYAARSPHLEEAARALACADHHVPCMLAGPSPCSDVRIARKSLSWGSMTKPALTVEEWANLQTADGWIDSIDGDLIWNRGDEWHQANLADGRHGLAALALHGQEFGFTWADEDLLRSLANVKTCGAVGDGVTDDTPAFQRAATVASLADRIEALLPPRAQ